MPVYQGFFSVFPTGVGVILDSTPGALIERGIPHRCGGDPDVVLN